MNNTKAAKCNQNHLQLYQLDLLCLQCDMPKCFLKKKGLFLKRQCNSSCDKTADSTETQRALNRAERKLTGRDILYANVACFSAEDESPLVQSVCNSLQL